MIPLAVIGGGSHGHALAEVAHACGFDTAFYDDDQQVGEPIDSIDPRGGWVLGVNNSRTRALIAMKRTPAGHPVRLRHPQAIWGDACRRGSGSVIAAGCILTRDVWIGDHTHLNVGATISQGCRLGNFVTVSPNATITGQVTIGDRTMIGAGSTIKNLITIGSDVTVGCGAVVVEDVPDGVTVVGVPARVLEPA